MPFAPSMAFFSVSSNLAAKTEKSYPSAKALALRPTSARSFKGIACKRTIASQSDGSEPPAKKTHPESTAAFFPNGELETIGRPAAN